LKNQVQNSDRFMSLPSFSKSYLSARVNLLKSNEQYDGLIYH